MKPKDQPLLWHSFTDDVSDDESCGKGSALFYCPEEGCVKSYQQFSSLEKHLDCDKHKFALEYETLYDKAMTMYAAKLESGAGVVPETGDEDVHVSIPMEVKNPALPMGWALKSATVTRKKLTVAQKNYLTEVFQAGNAPGDRLTLLTSQRQCDGRSTAMVPLFLKRTTSSHLNK